MLIRDYFYKYPLVFLQIGGWACYVSIDVLGHLNYSDYSYSHSITYGVAAFILTSCVALLNKTNNSSNPIFQSLFFIAILYIAAVIWHKIYSIIHLQADEALSLNVSVLFQQNLLQWFQIGYMPLFLFFAWGGCYIGVKWYRSHQAQQLKLTRALLDKKQAQLQTLRYQLNPHFLFNVLNSVDVSLLSDDKNTAHNMLKHLSAFLRSSLEDSESDKVSLEKEFELVNSFVAIEQLRFADALETKLNLSEHCRSALIPSMLLQPLVENAIKFGWSQKEKGYVSVSTSRQDNHLIINVRNNKTTEPLHKGTGTGLKNTIERLNLVYGNDASLTTSDNVHHFEVTMKIPWEEYL